MGHKVHTAVNSKTDLLGYDAVQFDKLCCHFSEESDVEHEIIIQSIESQTDLIHKLYNCRRLQKT
jgi:hypothetical protein